MSTPNFAFICGAARSGTSALWRLVAAHPAAAIGLERYMQRAVGGDFELSPALFEQQRFFQVEPGDTFYDSLSQFGGFYDNLAPRYENCTVRGDKIPRLYQRYAELNAAFDRPRILFIVRNIFDVAASYNKRAQEGQNWGAQRDYRVAVADWNESLAKTIAAFEDSDIFVLENETLFFEEAPIAPLFEFLGLDLPARVSQRYQQQLQQAIDLQEDRRDVLSAEQKRYICQYARFDDYRKLLDLARNKQRLLLPEQARAQQQPAAQMRGKYQAADIEVVDYQYQALPDSDVLYRGPAPTNLMSGGYLACIGGAQTLGRLVADPYASRVADQLGLELLNLGHGGGKPRYFTRTPAIIEHLNRAALVIVQIVSARAVENSVFKPVSVKNSFLQDKRQPSDAKPAFADHAYNRLVKSSAPDVLLGLVEETRENYLTQMRELLAAITAPTVLLWFSTRSPDYQPGFDNAHALLGDYPHFVNRPMVEEMAGLADGYVETVSDTGLPQPLLSRFDGRPVDIFEHQPCPSENIYYPSPEMHSEAAELLIEAIANVDWQSQPPATEESSLGNGRPPGRSS